MTIDNSQIIMFSDAVHEQVQQENARLRPYVEVKQMSGDVWAYDGIGRVEAREITGRVVPATFDNIDHFRRRISRQRFVVNLPVDAADERGAIQRIQTHYASAIAKAMLRQMDRVIYNSAFADVFTGRNFETTVTAATDGVLTVDATAGMTYEKLLEIRQNFWDNDVGLDKAEKMYGTITGKENTQLMGEEALTSGDFTRQFAVEKGSMVNAAGIDLIPFAASVAQPIIPAVSGVRPLLFASDRAICLAISKEMSVKIEPRSDYFETYQVQVIGEYGAVRTEGALLQRVNVTA